jgi:hypothetical protein
VQPRLALDSLRARLPHMQPIHGVRPSRHSGMDHTDRALSVWGPAGPKPYALNLWAMSASVSAGFLIPFRILLSSEPSTFSFSD